MDPARFWEITPRLLDIEFKGAAIRLRRERELAWFTAMLPELKERIPLEQFTGERRDDRDRARRFHEAWDKVDRALSRK